MKIKNIWLILIFTLGTTEATAGAYITKDASITGITSGNSSNPENERFALTVDKDFGECKAGDWVAVHRSDFGDNQKGYDAFLSMAISAFMSNSNGVSIFSKSGDCSRATWIYLKK